MDRLKQGHNILLIYLILLTIGNVQSQSGNEAYTYKCSNVHPMVFDSSFAQRYTYLLQKEHKRNLYTSSSDNLRLIHESKTPVSRHLLFQQYYEQLPIYNAYLKLNISNNQDILSVSDQTYRDVYQWNMHIDRKAFKKKAYIADSSWIHRIVSKYGKDIDIQNHKIILVEESNRPVVADRINIYGKNQGIHQELLVVNGQIKYAIDKNRRVDTSITVWVFNPNPITSANVSYGRPYIDDDDADIEALNAERIPKQVEATLEEGLFVLQNKYVKVADFSLPNTPQTRSNVPVFDFTRSQNGFEDVNVFYHITAFQKYIQSLGFSSLPGYTIEVDPHANENEDNSFFSTSATSMGQGRLFFGEGGVDDAEDGDVIIHEYAHALSEAASPRTAIGRERLALDEGLSDYFAASYSRSIDPFEWYKVFNWDGHNPFFRGRRADSDKRYPKDVDLLNIHQTGEIWSSALMEIWQRIGREKTDRLMLQTLFGLSVNMTFREAARLFLQADDLLYDKANTCIILSVFFKRGLIDTFTQPCQDTNIDVQLQADTIVCQGAIVDLAPRIQIQDSLVYRWSNSIDSVTFSTPRLQIRARQNVEYTLRATDQRGRFNQTSTRLVVFDCSKPVISNTQEFTRQTGALHIRFSDKVHLHGATVKLFDYLGREVYQNSEIKTTQFELRPTRKLPAGIYIVEAIENGSNNVQKVIIF